MHRCPANMAHTRQSRPDSDSVFQAQILKTKLTLDGGTWLLVQLLPLRSEATPATSPGDLDLPSPVRVNTCDERRRTAACAAGGVAVEARMSRQHGTYKTVEAVHFRLKFLKPCKVFPLCSEADLARQWFRGGLVSRAHRRFYLSTRLERHLRRAAARGGLRGGGGRGRSKDVARVPRCDLVCANDPIYSSSYTNPLKEDLLSRL